MNNGNPQEDTNIVETPAELRAIERLLDYDGEERRAEPDAGFEKRLLGGVMDELTPAPIALHDHPAARRRWGVVFGWSGAALAAGLAAFMVLPVFFSTPVPPAVEVELVSGATLEEDVAVLLALTESDSEWDAALLSVLADADGLLSNDGDLSDLITEGSI